MRPVASDGVAWFASVCVSVCWSRPWVVQKRQNRLRRRLGRFGWAKGTVIICGECRSPTGRESSEEWRGDFLARPKPAFRLSSGHWRRNFPARCRPAVFPLAGIRCSLVSHYIVTCGISTKFFNHLHLQFLPQVSGIMFYRHLFIVFVCERHNSRSCSGCYRWILFSWSSGPENKWLHFWRLGLRLGLGLAHCGIERFAFYQVSSDYFAPERCEVFAISVCAIIVCLSICLFQKPQSKLYEIFCTAVYTFLVDVAVARSSYDKNTIRYVLPVLWMMSYFHIWVKTADTVCRYAHNLLCDTV